MREPSYSLSKNISKSARLRKSARVVFGEVIYAPGGSHGPRRQMAWQLVLVFSGEARVTADDASLVIPAGHAGLLRPGRREEFHFAQTCATRHAWCSLQPALLSPALRESCERARTVQRLSGRLEALVEMGLSVPRHPASHALAEALGVAALEEYVLAGRLGRDARPEPDALWRALEWAAQLGGGPADLAEMARAAGVSKSQLAKLFRAHLGTTPMRHVWKARTERGVQLLRETGLSVAEAAYRCGFKTPFHFSRSVRQHFGAAPREVRKMSDNA